MDDTNQTTAKDPSGYVDIFAAYERLLQRPVLNTDHIDYLFFPCDQWARILAGGSRQCRVAARMTYSGSPVWENIGKPCEHVLKTGDSYRRHILLCHLGVRREDGHTQNDWICKFAILTTANFRELTYIQRNGGMRQQNTNKLGPYPSREKMF